MAVSTTDLKGTVSITMNRGPTRSNKTPRLTLGRPNPQKMTPSAEKLIAVMNHANGAPRPPRLTLGKPNPQKMTPSAEKLIAVMNHANGAPRPPAVVVGDESLQRNATAAHMQYCVTENIRLFQRINQFNEKQEAALKRMELSMKKMAEIGSADLESICKNLSDWSVEVVESDAVNLLRTICTRELNACNSSAKSSTHMSESDFQRTRARAAEVTQTLLATLKQHVDSISTSMAGIEGALAKRPTRAQGWGEAIAGMVGRAYDIARRAMSALSTATSKLWGVVMNNKGKIAAGILVAGLGAVAMPGAIAAAAASTSGAIATATSGAISSVHWMVSSLAHVVCEHGLGGEGAACALTFVCAAALSLYFIGLRLGMKGNAARAQLDDKKLGEFLRYTNPSASSVSLEAQSRVVKDGIDILWRDLQTGGLLGVLRALFAGGVGKGDMTFYTVLGFGIYHVSAMFGPVLATGLKLGCSAAGGVGTMIWEGGKVIGANVTHYAGAALGATGRATGTVAASIAEVPVLSVTNIMSESETIFSGSSSKMLVAAFTTMSHCASVKMGMDAVSTLLFANVTNTEDDVAAGPESFLWIQRMVRGGRANVDSALDEIKENTSTQLQTYKSKTDSELTHSLLRCAEKLAHVKTQMATVNQRIQKQSSA